MPFKQLVKGDLASVNSLIGCPHTGTRAVVDPCIDMVEGSTLACALMKRSLAQ